MWKDSTRGLGLQGGTPAVAVFWHMAPHSCLLCCPEERKTVLKLLWLPPAAVLKMGAQGSCCSPATFLLHPTLPSPRLSGYECGLPGHNHVCVYAIINLFVYIHETQHGSQRWHRRLVLALKKSCAHSFVCVFHHANKVVPARLSRVWSSFPEDPCCKTRRSKALDGIFFAMLSVKASKAFVKKLLC